MSNKVKLGDIIKPRKEKVLPAEFPDMPFIGMEHVEAHTMRLLGTVPALTMKSAANRFYAGDVLYGRLRPYLNKVYKPQCDGLCSAEFIVFPKTEGIHPDFLRYRLNAQDLVSFASHLDTGDRPRVNFDGLSSFEFILPSSYEDQQQIVAEIEKQLSRLDEAVASLTRIQANLKRYKAAVLKAAVEGKLTEQWRKDHPDVEPADQLLKRILAERRAKWEAEELAKMKAMGIKPKDDSWKKKYKEPAGPDTANLPELPEGWVWTVLENVAEVVDPHPSHRTPASVPNGVSYIGMGDITSEGKINFQQARKIADEVLIEHKERYSLKLGDFIFGKIGTIGKPVKLYGPFEYALSANVILVQPIPNATVPDYCFTFMASPLMDTVIKKESKATTQAAFGIQKVRLIAYSLPPQREQEEIRNEVALRLSVTEELETTIETNLKRAERLRQTILQQAFSGGLFSQRT